MATSGPESEAYVRLLNEALHACGAIAGIAYGTAGWSAAAAVCGRDTAYVRQFVRMPRPGLSDRQSASANRAAWQDGFDHGREHAGNGVLGQSYADRLLGDLPEELRAARAAVPRD